MDDDKEKSIVEKTVQTVKDIASTVSDAAKHAMEPEPLKPGEEAVTYTRMAGDGVVSDPMMPPFVVIPPRKKSTSKKAPKTTAKKTAKKTQAGLRAAEFPRVWPIMGPKTRGVNASCAQTHASCATRNLPLVKLPSG